MYEPFNKGDEFSMCCALNRSYPKVQDRCRSDDPGSHPPISRLTYPLVAGEAPPDVARALLWIHIPFLLHQSYNHSYHTFHQVMSPDRRAYSFKRHFILSYSYDRIVCTLYVPHPSLPPAKRPNRSFLSLTIPT